MRCSTEIRIEDRTNMVPFRAMKKHTHGFIESDELRDMGFKSVGQNVQVSASCEIVGYENVEIGDNVRIDAFCSVIATGFIRIGSYVHVGANSVLSGRGGIIMEDFAGLSGGVMLYSASDDYGGDYLTNSMAPKEHTNVKVAPIRIEGHAVIGAGSVVLPGVVVGQGAAVGALSKVDRSLDPWGIYNGNPCRRFGDRKRGLLERETAVRNSLRVLADM